MSTRSTPPYSIKKISRHGINLFVFNAAEHQPEKKPFLAVVLRPTAEAIGLGEEWFRIALSRSRNEDLVKSVREISFHPSMFDRVQVERGQTSGQTSGRGGARSRSYQCLPVTKLEILLNGIDVERLKNPQARSSILNMQKTVNDVIEHYYHRGVVVNKKATPEQLEKGREKLERLIAKLQDRNAALERKNESLEAKIDRLLARLDAMSMEIAELREHNKRVLARLDKALNRNDHLAASVKRNVGRANLTGWHLMRQEEVCAEQEAEIEALTERVSMNRNAKMKYKAMVAEYKMAMERVREDLPGFKGKKISKLPSFLRMELGKFLDAARLCFQSVLEQKKLTEEFKVMALNLFPEMSPKMYDDFVKEFNQPLKPEDYVMDAEPVTKKLNHG